VGVGQRLKSGSRCELPALYGVSRFVIAMADETKAANHIDFTSVPYEGPNLQKGQEELAKVRAKAGQEVSLPPSRLEFCQSARHTPAGGPAPLSRPRRARHAHAPGLMSGVCCSGDVAAEGMVLQRTARSDGHLGEGCVARCAHATRRECEGRSWGWPTGCLAPAPASAAINTRSAISSATTNSCARLPSDNNVKATGNPMYKTSNTLYGSKPTMAEVRTAARCDSWGDRQSALHGLSR
jgi:hypothetical protein